MSVEPFTFGFDEPQWVKIGDAVHEGLGVDPDPALRERIEKLVALHIRFRHLPELLAKRDDYEKRLASFAARRAWLRSSLGYAATTERMDADEAALIEKKRKLDALIAELPAPPSYRPNSTAARNLFWSDLIVIWSDIGGRESSAYAADFLIAVSEAISSRIRVSIPARNTVSDLLRVWARKQGR